MMLSCVLTISQKFPSFFKFREITDFKKTHRPLHPPAAIQSESQQCWVKGEPEWILMMTQLSDS